MKITKAIVLDRVFKDSKGRIVLWQSPNIPLWGWLAFRLIGYALPGGRLKTGCAQLATALLFTWAFLEVTSGVNYFRRFVGVVVLVAIVSGFFMR